MTEQWMNVSHPAAICAEKMNKWRENAKFAWTSGRSDKDNQDCRSWIRENFIRVRSVSAELWLCSETWSTGLLNYSCTQHTICSFLLLVPGLIHRISTWAIPVLKMKHNLRQSSQAATVSENNNFASFSTKNCMILTFDCQHQLKTQSNLILSALNYSVNSSSVNW